MIGKMSFSSVSSVSIGFGFDIEDAYARGTVKVWVMSSKCKSQVLGLKEDYELIFTTYDSNSSNTLRFMLLKLFKFFARCKWNALLEAIRSLQTIGWLT